MFTVFAMFRKRAGMSMEAFIDYYENHHSKLGVGLPGLVRYTRNYLTPAPYPVGGEVGEPAYDVITEMVFESREAYERGFSGGLSNPRIEAMVIADEERLFDRSQSRLVFVESHTSELKPITPGAR